MRRALASLALLLSFLAAPLSAQERVRFEASVHLQGWEEAAFSDFSDLYDLKPFEAQEGQLLDAAGLAGVQAAWKAEGERVAALLAAERADPRRWGLFLLERARGRQPALSKLVWTRVDDVDGFTVYVQKTSEPGQPDPAVVARESVARVLPLREHFRRVYAEPGKLVRHADSGAEALLVFTNLQDLKAYWTATGFEGHYKAVSSYDPRLRAAVLLEEPFETSITAEDKRVSARHAYAHLLLHAYDKAQAPLQQDWLREGLASYLALLPDSPGGGLAAGDPPQEVLKRLIAATQDPKTVLLDFERIEELFATPTNAQVRTRAEKQAEKAGIPAHRVDYEEVVRCRARESLLLVDFLQRGERAAAFPGYLARELAGEGGLKAFRAAFPAGAEADLDQAFLEFLFAEHRRLLPEVPVNAAAIDAILRGDASLLATAPAGASGGGGSAPGGKRPPVFASSVEPADLAPQNLRSEAVLALALDLARRGRSAEAERGLTGHLEAGKADQALRARLERERDRLAAWNRLRAAWFADLAAAGKTYKLEHEGKAVRARIKGVEGTRVLLEENRAERAELDLEALDPVELAKEMGREAEALPDGWARDVPAALGGDAQKVARSLDPADPAQAAFAADLEAGYDALLARGRPLGELLLLSQQPMPRDPAGARDALERLGAVGRGREACPELEARLPLVRGYARQLFEVVFEEKGPRQLVHGAWDQLAGGRAKLSYAFEDPSELGDFHRDDGYIEVRRDMLGALEGKTQVLEVRNGGIAGLGRAVLVHDLVFSAPLSMTYTVSYDKAGTEVPKPKTWFYMAGVCGDGDGNCAAVLGEENLEVVENGSPQTAYASAQHQIQFGKPYKVEIVHDGGSVKLLLDGALQQELPTNLKSGRVFLVFHTDRGINIKGLVIEGVLEPGSIAAARQRWCEERVAELGL